MPKKHFLGFGPVTRAVFEERPNRFIVHARAPELGRVRAFLPNPGRLRELLLPDSVVHVAEAAPQANTERKTRYTVVAVERDGIPVMLHTHATNQVARHLIEHRQVPPLENAEIVRAEVPVGHSRFDFLLRDGRGGIYLEVKSCTLFGNGVAMFPDAVTDRGRRHLLELAAMAREGTRTAVLFVVHTLSVDYFMPDYHTDLAFSRTFLEVKDDVPIYPMAVTWTPKLALGRRMKMVDIPWDYIEQEAHDRGSYLVILRFDRAVNVKVGKLGEVRLNAGHYVYVGSAMANLSARVQHHLRIRKKRHWHMDYIRPHAAQAEALPIRSSQRIECTLAHELAQVLEPGPEGFGCSDCPCPTHLFFSKEDPQSRPDFHALLQRFRMRHPGNQGSA